MESPGTLAALARQLLMGLDRTRDETPVRTSTLELILNGLIGLAEPDHEAELARRAQGAHMARVLAASRPSEVPDDG